MRRLTYTMFHSRLKVRESLDSLRQWIHQTPDCKNIVVIRHFLQIPPEGRVQGFPLGPHHGFRKPMPCTQDRYLNKNIRVNTVSVGSKGHSCVIFEIARLIHDFIAKGLDLELRQVFSRATNSGRDCFAWPIRYAAPSIRPRFRGLAEEAEVESTSVHRDSYKIWQL